MGLVSDLENQVREYLSGDYQISEFPSIPSVDNVSLGKKAKKVNLCAFCIDLRNSTDLLYQHQEETAGRVHKAFLTVVANVVVHFGGKLRSFNGDGLKQCLNLT